MHISNKIIQNSEHSNRDVNRLKPGSSQIVSVSVSTTSSALILIWKELPRMQFGFHNTGPY